MNFEDNPNPLRLENSTLRLQEAMKLADGCYNTTDFAM